MVSLGSTPPADKPQAVQLTVHTETMGGHVAGPAGSSRPLGASGEWMTYEEAEKVAAEEGLVLVRHNNATGFKGVTLSHCSLRSPYQAHSRYKGRKVHLGVFGTAWEAALCYARHVGPEQARREAEDAEAVVVSGDTTPRRGAGCVEGLSVSAHKAQSHAASAQETEALTPEFKFSNVAVVAGVDGEATKAALTLQTLRSWPSGDTYLPTPAVRVKSKAV